MFPNLLEDHSHEDVRGTLFYTNDFHASAIKRIYVIENQNTDLVRAWRGHEIEQRWFSAMMGSFKIELIAIDNWDRPNKNQNVSSLCLIPKNWINFIFLRVMSPVSSRCQKVLNCLLWPIICWLRCKTNTAMK